MNGYLNQNDFGITFGLLVADEPSKESPSVDESNVRLNELSVFLVVGDPSSASVGAFSSASSRDVESNER